MRTFPLACLVVSVLLLPACASNSGAGGRSADSAQYDEAVIAVSGMT